MLITHNNIQFCYHQLNSFDFKREKIIAILLILALVFMSSSFLRTPKEDIIGKWISEKNSNWTVEFTTDGKCYWNYPNEDTEIFTYTITSTSPQCGYDVKTGGAEDYYLELVDENNNKYCYEILSINSE